LVYNVPGLDALHQGIEVDLVYNITDDLRMTGMLSLGNWKWKNDASGDIFDEAGDLIRTVDVYAEDLKVSDAAQTTWALGLNYNLMPRTSLYLDYNYAGDIYAQYDITRRDDETNREDSWKLPAFHLFDLGMSHKFDLGPFDSTLSARMNNIFNVEHITDAYDGEGSTWQTATVYYGYGRTFSLGLKIRF